MSLTLTSPGWAQYVRAQGAQNVFWAEGPAYSISLETQPGQGAGTLVRNWFRRYNG